MKTVASKGRSLADELPWAGMVDVDAGILITKDALLMRTYVIRPKDLSYAQDQDVEAVLRALSNSFRQVSDDGWSLYVDAHRIMDSIPAGPCDGEAPELTRIFEDGRSRLSPFFFTRFFLTVCKSLEEDTSRLKGLLFDSGSSPSGGAENGIGYQLLRFRDVTDDFGRMIRSAFDEVRIAGSDELLTYLHATVSDNRHPVLTPELPFYLDWYLADGTLEPDVVCRYNGSYIVTASVHDFPSETHAGMVSRVLGLDVPFRLCTRFIFASRDRTRRELKGLRKSQFQRRKGAGSMFQEAVMREESVLEDTEALSLARDAGEALSTLASGDVTYGRTTTTVVVRDSSYGRAMKKLDLVKKAINDLGFIAKTETINNPGAFLGSLPGNVRRNPRQPLLSTRNLAHFFPLSVPWEGRPVNSHLEEVLGARSPHILCKTGHSPFFLNLNVGDVGHTLVVGPTGAGKSILLAALAVFWLKYRSARVIFFDKDRSSYHACLNSGGLFVEVGGDREGLKLNPFGRLETREDLVFTTGLVVAYLNVKGVRTTPRDESAVYDAVASMTSVDEAHRDFALFRNHVQDREIRSALDAFVTGEHSPLFTPGRDAVEARGARWLTFEMAPLLKKGAALAQLVLSYLFHRVEEAFDGSPTLLLIDESWSFLDNESFRTVLREWLKVLRKRNVYCVLATQEMADARGSGIFSTIVNACMTKILLPNSQASQGENASLYEGVGLSGGDIQALAQATPKRDYFYASPLGKQLFRLDLADDEIALLKGPREAGRSGT